MTPLSSLPHSLLFFSLCLIWSAVDAQMVGSWAGDHRLQGRQNGRNGQPDTSAFNIVNGRVFTPGLGIILAVCNIHIFASLHYLTVSAATLHSNGRRLSTHRSRRIRRRQTPRPTAVDGRPSNPSLQHDTLPDFQRSAEELHHIKHHHHDPALCRHHDAGTGPDS